MSNRLAVWDGVEWGIRVLLVLLILGNIRSIFQCTTVQLIQFIREVDTVRRSRIECARLTLSRACREREIKEGRSNHIAFKVNSTHLHQYSPLHSFHYLWNHRENGMEYVSLLNSIQFSANSYSIHKKQRTHPQTHSSPSTLQQHARNSHLNSPHPPPHPRRGHVPLHHDWIHPRQIHIHCVYHPRTGVPWKNYRHLHQFHEWSIDTRRGYVRARHENAAVLEVGGWRGGVSGRYAVSWGERTSLLLSTIDTNS